MYFHVTSYIMCLSAWATIYHEAIGRLVITGRAHCLYFRLHELTQGHCGNNRGRIFFP